MAVEPEPRRAEPGRFGAGAVPCPSPRPSSRSRQPPSASRAPAQESPHPSQTPVPEGDSVPDAVAAKPLPRSLIARVKPPAADADRSVEDRRGTATRGGDMSRPCVVLGAVASLVVALGTADATAGRPHAPATEATTGLAHDGPPGDRRLPRRPRRRSDGQVTWVRAAGAGRGHHRRAAPPSRRPR